MSAPTPSSPAASSLGGPPPSLLLFLIVLNTNHAFTDTTCPLYNLLYGLSVFALYSLFAFDRIFKLPAHNDKTTFYYFCTYLMSTMVSAAVVAAIIVLGRDGSKRYDGSEHKGEGGDELMSRTMFAVVVLAAVACVAAQVHLVVPLRNRLAAYRRLGPGKC